MPDAIFDLIGDVLSAIFRVGSRGSRKRRRR